MKRKLIVEEWMSLDGHITDKYGKLDFFARHVRESYTTEHRQELLNSVDTIVFGRKTYEQFSVLWPQRPIEDDILANKINTLEKIVCSNSLTKAPWGQWPEASIESGDPVEKLAKLKSKSGKNIVIWGSITLVQTLIANDLVDEFHIHLCPILTGGGRTFFNQETKETYLTLADSITLPNGIVLLKYTRTTSQNSN